jgi:ribosome-associated toxin RatA of RatAB toxin-antitoxin module
MSNISFEKSLLGDYDKILKKVMDFEKYPEFMPGQLKSVKILKTDNNEILTEETLFFQTVIKKTIVQQTLHKKSPSSLESKIISGPAKNTTVFVHFEESDGKTKVSVNIDLKLSLTMKILEPLIKKYYKSFFNSFLNRLVISTM